MTDSDAYDFGRILFFFACLTIFCYKRISKLYNGSWWTYKSVHHWNKRFAQTLDVSSFIKSDLRQKITPTWRLITTALNTNVCFYFSARHCVKSCKLFGWNWFFHYLISRSCVSCCSGSFLSCTASCELWHQTPTVMKVPNKCKTWMAEN